LKPDATALPTPPFPMDSTLSTKMTINIFEPAYNFRFDGFGGPALVLGVRYLDIEMKMTPDITGPSLPVDPPVEPPFSGGSLEVGPSWWDYFVGIKTHNSVSANWDFSFYGTIGGGESHAPWTLQAMFGRRFSNDNRLGLGVRIWGIDYSENEGVMNQYTRIDATFTGFMIGYEFNSPACCTRAAGAKCGLGIVAFLDFLAGVSTGVRAAQKPVRHGFGQQ
jgi:hypothetical protein